MQRDLKLIALALFTLGFGEGMFVYFQPIYLQQLGADPLKIGAILSVYGIVMVLAPIPSGLIADRIGRRQVILFGYIIELLATICMFLAQSLPLFILGMLMFASTIFMGTALFSYATAARGDWSVRRAVSLISTSFSLGLACGPLAGGLIGELYGLKNTFLLALIVFFVSTLVAMRIGAQPVEKRPARSEQNEKFINGRLVIYLSMVFIVLFAGYIPQPFSQNFLHNERGLSLSQIGLLTSLTGLGVAAANYLFTGVDPRLGFPAAQFTMVLYCVLLWQFDDIGWYALAYLLLGGYRTTRTLAMSEGPSLVIAANMGLAYGVIDSTCAAATILAPLLSGLLYQQNPELPYIVGSAAILTTMILSAVVRSALHRPAKPAYDK